MEVISNSLRPVACIYLFMIDIELSSLGDEQAHSGSCGGDLGRVPPSVWRDRVCGRWQ